MYYKVKIKKLPNKELGGTKTGQQNSDGSLAIQPTAMGGADIDQYIGKPDTEVKKSLSRVPRDEANLEAEGGETAYGDINGDGMLEHYNIVGPRHNAGGVPLDLPDDSFIFSDFNQMKIKDPKILKQFGKATENTKKSKGYTPAQLAKQYDINKYRKILQDPNSDSLDKKTAEIMIKNYNMKLGGLAIAQESLKAFPQGIPTVAKPFMEANGISEEQLIPQKQEAPEQMPSGEPVAMPEEIPMDPNMMEQPTAAYGYEVPSYMAYGGYIPQAQEGISMYDPYNRPQEEIDRDNEAYFERTKNLTLPKTLNKSKGQKFLSDMNQAIESGYENEPWFNMDMKPQQLQKYYQQFDESGNFIPPRGARTWEPPKAQAGRSVQPPYSEKEAYTPKGVEQLNQYRRMYGLPQLKGSLTETDIRKAAGELQAKISQDNPELVLDYMSRRSHQPNKKLLAKIPKAYPKTTEGVRQAYEAGDISAQDIRDAYKDDKWWYRALETNVKELGKEEYEAKMTAEGAIKQGDKIYFQDDPDNPQLYTEYVMKDGEPVPTNEVKTATEIEEKEGERPDIVDPEFAQPPGAVAPEWMTPDLMNYYGTLKDRYSLKKYFPWSPRYEPEVPRPTFLDPTRELAAQSEQANILTEGLGQFVGPQALSARASSIQGQGAKQAADTLGRYNNANVGIANEFAMSEANIRNQAQQQNQAISKQLYDQNTFTNQQYDNSLRAADAAKRMAFGTGWKNASDLAAVNASSDQYDIDPRTGAVVFGNPKQYTPETSKDFNYWLEYYKTEFGMSDKDAIAAAKSATGGGSNYYGPDPDTVIRGMAEGGMVVMGGMTYPFGL
jgi:hypothetical protein